MKSRAIYLSLLLTGLLSATVASAEVTIGNGFTCQGSAVMKGDQLIQYSKARSNLLRTLEKLKKKLAAATTKKKKAAIKAQIKAANNSKTLLKACSSGQLDANQVDPIFTQLAAGNGTFNGTYSGTVTGIFTIPISGPITYQFILDGTTFSTILTLGGNLGSSLNAQPLTFSADVGGIGFPAQFFLPDTFLGAVTLSVTQDGHLTITNSGSSSTVSLDGQFGAEKITGTTSGVIQGQTFNGTFSCTR